MKDWMRGKSGGLAVFLIIAGLVAGGLGWASAAVLRLEGEQRAQRQEAELASRLRLALWRLDSRILPLLAREDSRPFSHYSTVFAPPLAFSPAGKCCLPGTVLETSPLLGADLQDWMLLHFQVDQKSGWESPQAPSEELLKRLDIPLKRLPHTNISPERKQLLDRLAHTLAAPRLLEIAREKSKPLVLRETTLVLTPQQQAQPPQQLQRQQDLGNNYSNNANPANPQNNDPGQQGVQDFQARAQLQNKLLQDTNRSNNARYPRAWANTNTYRNGADWLDTTSHKETTGTETEVSLGSMFWLWLPACDATDHLAVARMVRIGDREVCQGIVLDQARLQEILAEEVIGLFPQARIVPVKESEPLHPERTMTTLPLELDPGPAPAADEGGTSWTPLSLGLLLAWAAVLVALFAVGAGGWSLIDLSERRIRFVSAVTHELRTPLTTLRLYLDMLLGGLVRDEHKRQDYLQTLQAEADRLNRLVGNVLDFSRLEKQQPRLARTRVKVSDLLASLQTTWEGRCRHTEKELILENQVGADADLCTDGELLQQVLGNLIDNACKYSHGAEDARLWVRVRRQGKEMLFEVEDRGPGVPRGERRSIFRAFRRGQSADVTAGGVGLGLALARRWTRLLGGQLTLQPVAAASGACFQVRLANS